MIVICMLTMDENGKVGCSKKRTFPSIPAFLKSFVCRKRKEHQKDVDHQQQNTENTETQISRNPSTSSGIEEPVDQNVATGHTAVTMTTTVETDLRTNARVSCQDSLVSYWISEVINSCGSEMKHASNVQPDPLASYTASHFTSEDFKTHVDSCFCASGQDGEGSSEQLHCRRVPIENHDTSSIAPQITSPAERDLRMQKLESDPTYNRERKQPVLHFTTTVKHDPMQQLGTYWRCHPEGMFQMIQSKRNCGSDHHGGELMTEENLNHASKHWIERDQNHNESRCEYPDADWTLMSFTKPHVLAVSHQGSRHPVTSEQETSIPPQMRQTRPPTVFMTYAEEPAKEHHQGLIRSMAAALIECGIKVHLDMHETIEMSSSICGWLHENIDNSDFVIACVSPSYKSQVEENLPLRSSDHSLQSCYVYSRLLTDYIDNCSRNRQFIPVLVGGTTRKDLPSLYKNTIHYKWPHDTKKIIFRLYGKEMYTPPKLGTAPSCVFESCFSS